MALRHQYSDIRSIIVMRQTRLLGTSFGSHSHDRHKLPALFIVQCLLCVSLLFHIISGQRDLHPSSASLADDKAVYLHSNLRDRSHLILQIYGFFLTIN